LTRVVNGRGWRRFGDADGDHRVAEVVEMLNSLFMDGTSLAPPRQEDFGGGLEGFQAWLEGQGFTAHAVWRGDPRTVCTACIACSPGEDSTMSLLGLGFHQH
jgi:hypothetical protein